MELCKLGWYKFAMKIKSAEHFIKLRESENPEEYRLATWGEATEHVWFDIIDRHPAMRRWVAQNKTISPEILATLAADPDVRVRYAVLATLDLHPDVLSVLAKDSDASIRRGVISHAQLPIEALKALCDDPDPDVAGDAAEHLEWISLHP